MTVDTNGQAVAVVEANEQEDLFGNTYADVPQVDRAQLANTLHDVMSKMTLDQVVAIMTNRYVETIEYIALTQGANACQKMSLLFNPQRLDTMTPNSKSSIFAALQRHEFHKGLARATLFKTKSTPLSSLFYFTIQLGINAVQYVNEYPPHVARDFCKQYRLNTQSVVLDPCAGWGGRMIGTSTVAGEYVGYEPATRTAAGLAELLAFIKSINPAFDATVHCEPYEDSIEHEAHYDFALTSPPYYDTEIYSDEPTNSLNRYSTFDEWVASFFCPLIDKTMRQLKPGAAFVINIGSRRWPLSTVLREHCADRYELRQVADKLSNTPGLYKDPSLGEAFFELRNSDDKYLTF
jgi:hypothetical protein